MKNNNYINTSLNWHQKSFLFFLLILLILIVVYINTKEFFNKQDYIPPYDTVMKSININNAQSLYTVEKFVLNNRNIYGYLASLKLAKIYIQCHKLNNALKILTMGKKDSVDSNLWNLISIRIAQIQYQKNYVKEMMQTIHSITNKELWKSIKNDLKGNILLQLNRKQEAIRAWKNAIFYKNISEINKIIQMKLNDLIQQEDSK